MDYDNETKSSGGSNGVLIMWENQLTLIILINWSDNDTVNTAVRVRAFGGGSAIFSNNDQVEASNQAATQKLAFSYSVLTMETQELGSGHSLFSGEAC